jgi:hypothetical protein
LHANGEVFAGDFGTGDSFHARLIFYFCYEQSIG